MWSPLTLAAATWYLNAGQPSGADWDAIPFWSAAPDGSGGNPSLISEADTFDSNGKILRTPAQESYFGGASLVLSGSRLLMIQDADILEKRTDCSARQLAKLEKTSEPTVSMTLSLMRLTPSIREAMQLLIATGKADHLGLRALAKVAAVPAQKQGAAFTALLRRWRIEPENAVSKKL